MTLQQVLKLQVVYVVTGIAYNIVSWRLLLSQETPLSPTNPQVGIIVLLIYGTFLMAGYFKKILLYRVLMGMAVFVFGYGGIIIHLVGLTFHIETYHSIQAGLLAIFINLFGTVLNLFVLLNKFEKG